MSWRLLLESGATSAGTTLTRGDCKKVLEAFEVEAQRVCELFNSRAAADVDVAVARGEAGEMQRRLFAAEARLREEQQRFTDASFSDIDGTACAWCGAELGRDRTAVEGHLRACTHHPLGQALRQLDAARETIGQYAEALRTMRVDTVNRFGAAGYARLMDLARAAHGADPDEVTRLVREQTQEAVEAERQRWRDALAAHGLHTLPANECFAKVLEQLKEE